VLKRLKAQDKFYQSHPLKVIKLAPQACEAYQATAQDTNGHLKAAVIDCGPRPAVHCEARICRQADRVT